MSQYFRIPFANAGTRATIPNTQPANGAINYSTGYPNVYELDPANPLALRVERDFFNELQYQITDTLRLLYEQAIPPFITSAMNGGSAFSYAKDALVRHNNVVYSSNEANNTTTPPGASWTVVDMAVFNAKASTNSPTFTGVPLAPTASIPYPASASQIMNAQATSDLLAYYGYVDTTPRYASNLDNIIGPGVLYFNNSSTGRPADPGSTFGTVTTHFRGSTQTATQIAFCSAGGVVPDMYVREKSANVWRAWRRFWHAGNSTVIIDQGNSSNGYFEIYSNGCVRVQRTVTHSGGGTLYALPFAMNSISGAGASILPLVGSSPAPGPYGIDINAANYSIYGPAAALTLSFVFPFGA